MKEFESWFKIWDLINPHLEEHPEINETNDGPFYVYRKGWGRYWFLEYRELAVDEDGFEYEKCYTIASGDSLDSFKEDIRLAFRAQKLFLQNFTHSGASVYDAGA